MRWVWLALVLPLLVPADAAAEWQIRPFIGFTFGGATKFVDPEGAVGTKNTSIGVSGGWLGEIFGVEADYGFQPGFFERDDFSDPVLGVISSGVTTLTGNVVIALPKRLSGYGLRPYFSGGAGLVHAELVGQFQGVEFSRTLPAISLGGGVTGFITNRVGLNWEIRRLSTFRGGGETVGNSFGNEQLSFWRATMAVAIRY